MRGHPREKGSGRLRGESADAEPCAVRQNTARHEQGSGNVLGEAALPLQYEIGNPCGSLQKRLHETAPPGSVLAQVLTGRIEVTICECGSSPVERVSIADGGLEHSHKLAPSDAGPRVAAGRSGRLPGPGESPGRGAARALVIPGGSARGTAHDTCALS
ncbi:hypothetical protein GCM10010271_27000 [Streptomyces kurssanovii]|nr:hypothetical protein GCM10010271_27000 [Streptomyces kurssanovii]